MEYRNPLIFIVGGARSGKSSYGETLVQTFAEPRVYIATAEAFDEELKERIEMHQKRREGIFLLTIEEPINLAQVILHRPKRETLFIDCLSVFLGNLFHYYGSNESFPQLEELYRALEERKQPIIVISNEVGEGIVPENEMARHYRDMSGWMNQRVAKIADVVIKMTCGIPQIIKGELS
ncbi:MAG: bifunctional adenosylcobinamide kinase/adenosylcobinamide-phosphate guanylyltransferase [Spirochaetia bacterium]|nr:bifunctional adenosylcobinamide kinase/adenosylcobinamide-phosphate guanylyltransferase [Spirochaetia bacterium]